LVNVASALAAQGAFMAALALLEGTETSDAFTLRGKIAAQRRRYPEAITSLTRALELEPSHHAAMAALDCVKRIERDGDAALTLRRLGLIMAMGFPVVVVAGALVFAVRAGPGPTRAIPVAISGLSSSAALSGLERPNLASQHQETPNAGATSTSIPVTPPTLDLQVAGVGTHAEGDEMVVAFEHGLFDTGQTAVRSEELAAVKAVGRSLGLLGTGICVVVEGHTDEQPVTRGRYRDNAELAISRATTVAEELRGASGLDFGAFSVRGADSPPGTLDADSRARARSAVVRIRKTR
jgi:flagellar motor protein MotB